jgi:hypothetical protein
MSKTKKAAKVKPMKQKELDSMVKKILQAKPVKK